MKEALSLKELSPKKILKLKENIEGSIILRNVTPKDVQEWEERYPEIIESTKIRHEYNFLSECFIIKCSQTHTHDSLQGYFKGTIYVGLFGKLGVEQTMSLVTVNSGTGTQLNKYRYRKNSCYLLSLPGL